MLTARPLTLWAIVIRIFVAVISGGLIGLDREKKNRPAGLRTYMLVTLGSCIVMLLNQYVYQVYSTGDPARLGAQVISGIGFLGAGTIIVTTHNQIKGLTTAAGLWASACVGLTIGVGLYEVAVAGVTTIYVVLNVLNGWEYRVREKAQEIVVYIELARGVSLGSFIRSVRELDLQIYNLQQDQNIYGQEGIAFVVNVRGKKVMYQEDLIHAVRKIAGVKYLEVLS